MKKLFIIPLLLFFVSISCKKETFLNSFKNKQPIANAGKDLEINLPLDSIWLDGSESIDLFGRISFKEWKQISGPDVISNKIDNALALKTKAKLTVAGTYLFELLVRDNDRLVAKDTVQVVVNDFINPQELSGIEMVFDDLVWEPPPGIDPWWAFPEFLTPHHPELFLNPYVNVEVFLKLDNVNEWIEIKPAREQHRNSPSYINIYTVFNGRLLVISDFVDDLTKASIKVKFL